MHLTLILFGTMLPLIFFGILAMYRGQLRA